MNARLVNILIQYAEEAYLKCEFDGAMGYADKAIELSRRLQHNGELGKIYFLKGKVLNKQGNFGQNTDLLKAAEAFFHQAQTHGNLNQPAEIPYQLGNNKFYKNDFEGACKLFEQALFEAENNANWELVLLIQTAQSRVQSERKKFKKALQTMEGVMAILHNQMSIRTRLECMEQFLSIHIRLGRFAPIREHAPSALELAKSIQDIEHEIKIMNSLAIAHAVKAEYKQAFDYLVQVKSKSEAIGLNESTTKALINIGNIYSALSNYAEAYNNMKRLAGSPELLRGLSDYLKGLLYYNLGCVSYLNEQTNEGLYYLEKARMLGEEFDNARLIARSQYEIMRIYLEQNRIDEAMALAQTTEQLYEQIGREQGSENHHANLAEINLIKENYEKAIEHAQKSVELCQQSSNHKTRKRSYKLLSDTYKAKGDLDDAYHYLDLYAQASEDFFKEMRRRAMIDLEMQYENKEKSKEIELLRSQMQYKELELQHTQELAEKNKKVAAAQEDVKQFTYAVSHDLKEPLRMIGSFSRLLSKKYKKETDETDQEYFGYISDGVKRMTGLLDGLLEYAKLGKHSEKLELVDLQRVFEDICITLHVKIQESDAKVYFEDLPTIYTNRMMIFQLFQNLVANAVKFRKPDVAPIVNIEFEETEEDFKIKVIDNGIGIPEQHQKTIFKIFARLHRKEEYEGTGIGLAMCKKIVTHLKGDINLTSEVGVGTTFVVTLPQSDIQDLEVAAQ